MLGRLRLIMLHMVTALTYLLIIIVPIQQQYGDLFGPINIFVKETLSETPDPSTIGKLKISAFFMCYFFGFHFGQFFIQNTLKSIVVCKCNPFGGKPPKARKPLLWTNRRPTDDQPAAEEFKYSYDRARRHRCQTNNLFKVWQNLAPFGGSGIEGRIEFEEQESCPYISCQMPVCIQSQ